MWRKTRFSFLLSFLNYIVGVPPSSSLTLLHFFESLLYSLAGLIFLSFLKVIYQVFLNKYLICCLPLFFS
ncbi:hypothetical protein F5879DRAFT_947380 [Lentinula edodes]|nr:hypothetical protein F5879DRAFT_947380 [Lentinula edodes]